MWSLRFELGGVIATAFAEESYSSGIVWVEDHDFYAIIIIAGLLSLSYKINKHPILSLSDKVKNKALVIIIQKSNLF